MAIAADLGLRKMGTTHLLSIGTLSFNLLKPFLLLSVCGRLCAFTKCDNAGLGVDSGKEGSSGLDTTRAWRMFVGKTMGGNVMSS
jgi:hypothetical protein